TVAKRTQRPLSAAVIICIINSSDTTIAVISETEMGRNSQFGMNLRQGGSPLTRDHTPPPAARGVNPQVTDYAGRARPPGRSSKGLPPLHRGAVDATRAVLNESPQPISEMALGR